MDLNFWKKEFPKKVTKTCKVAGEKSSQLIEEAKLCKWKNAKRKGKSYSLLAGKVTFYVLPRLIKNKDEVYSIQQEILKQAEDNIGKPFERYVYDIIDYKWKSEELMLECVEKVFRKNTVIHQYRPYFLRSPKGQLSYDVFVCGKNIAFEYQGKQHFEQYLSVTFNEASQTSHCFIFFIFNISDFISETAISSSSMLLHSSSKGTIAR